MEKRMILSLVPLHAFGTRYDLPAPLYLFLLGAGAVVFASFLLVLRRPVKQQVASGEDVPAPPLTPMWPQVAALVIGVLLAAAGLFGSQSVPDNILPTMFWLVFWIAVPISIAVIGNSWPYVSPLNLIARIAGPRARLKYPQTWGYWPATVLFFLFACGELVFNAVATTPANTALIMLEYAVLTAIMAAIYGAEAWLRHGEVFSVLFATWGRLGWFRFGAPGRRGFFGGLERPFTPSLSRLTFVLLLLVSVSFDGLLATPAWKSFASSLPGALRPAAGEFHWGYAIVQLVVFTGLIAAIWGLFTGFAAAVRAAGHLDAPLISVVAGLVPSLVPIAFGYLVAHNFGYLAINGQLLIHQVSDPLGTGLDLFGTANYEVNRNLIPTAFIWYFQIALIITVHVIAVILAHGYLGRTARTEAQGRRAEWPWIAAMVGYTMSSLWLLAQPIVQEGVKG
jgi:hypothetical protein